MEKPIRVLQVLGIVAGGGVESVIMNYYEHIDQSKVQFDFIVHDDNKIDITEKVEKLGGRVYKVTPYYKNPVAFVWDIYKIIKRHHYRIVHSNMNTLSVFPLFAAWIAGVPVRILHNHSTTSKLEIKRNILKLILRPLARLFANRYFACSRLAANWMYGKNMVNKGKVVIIHNAIDLDKFTFNQEKRKALRKELSLEGKFVIGHVGRFAFVKNHEFLIDVFAEVVKENLEARLILLGDGPLKKHIQQKVKKLGLSGEVQFLGIRNDIADLYNVMDLFLLPSYYEGLPVVGVEAQANGLPMIVSNHVTREMKVTDIVTYEKLEKNEANWIKAVKKCIVQGQRGINTHKQMENAGFDIMIESDRLLKIYQRISHNLILKN